MVRPVLSRNEERVRRERRKNARPGETIKFALLGLIVWGLLTIGAWWGYTWAIERISGG